MEGNLLGSGDRGCLQQQEGELQKFSDALLLHDPQQISCLRMKGWKRTFLAVAAVVAAAVPVLLISSDLVGTLVVSVPFPLPSIEEPGSVEETTIAQPPANRGGGVVRGNAAAFSAGGDMSRFVLRQGCRSRFDPSSQQYLVDVRCLDRDTERPAPHMPSQLSTASLRQAAEDERARAAAVGAAAATQGLEVSRILALHLSGRMFEIWPSESPALLADETLLDGVVQLIPQWAVQAGRNFHSKLFLHSMDYGNSDLSAGNISARSTPRLASTAMPLLWKHGFTGTSQIIGLADTGVDHDHCLFYDPGRPMEFNAVMHDHRKFVVYVAPHGDIQDDITGHGTFCAGSLVGSVAGPSPSPLNVWGGAAPDAKLAFFDIGYSRNGRVYMTVPEDLSDQLYGVLHANGARVQSMSWGIDINEYDSLAMSSDVFLWRRRDAMIAFAVGNIGREATVGTPATAKNGISVGAIDNVQATVAGDAPFHYLQGTVIRAQPAGSPNKFYGAVFAAFASEIVVVPDAAISCRNFTGNAAAASSSSSASLSSPSSSSAPKASGSARQQQPLAKMCVVMRRTAARERQERGVAASVWATSAAAPVTACGFDRLLFSVRQVYGCDGAVLFYNSPVDSDSPVMSEISSLGEDLPRYVGLLPVEIVQNHLLPRLADGSLMSFEIATEGVCFLSSRRMDVKQPTPLFRNFGRAKFSSQGPNADGRIAPMLMAPGSEIYSSRSDQNIASRNCDLKTMSGTSMATPIFAGSLALVREALLNMTRLDRSRSNAPSRAASRAVAAEGVRRQPTNVSGMRSAEGPSGQLLRAVSLAMSTPSAARGTDSAMANSRATLANNVEGAGLFSQAERILDGDKWVFHDGSFYDELDGILQGQIAPVMSLSIRRRMSSPGFLTDPAPGQLVEVFVKIVLAWSDPPPAVLPSVRTNAVSVNNLDLFAGHCNSTGDAVTITEVLASSQSLNDPFEIVLLRLSVDISSLAVVGDDDDANRSNRRPLESIMQEIPRGSMAPMCVQVVGKSIPMGPQGFSVAALLLSTETPSLDDQLVLYANWLRPVQQHRLLVVENPTQPYLIPTEPAERTALAADWQEVGRWYYVHVPRVEQATMLQATMWPLRRRQLIVYINYPTFQSPDYSDAAGHDVGGDVMQAARGYRILPTRWMFDDAGFHVRLRPLAAFRYGVVAGIYVSRDDAAGQSAVEVSFVVSSAVSRGGSRGSVFCGRGAAAGMVLILLLV